MRCGRLSFLPAWVWLSLLLLTTLLVSCPDGGAGGGY
jgi:hypothetical protein